MHIVVASWHPHYVDSVWWAQYLLAGFLASYLVRLHLNRWQLSIRSIFILVAAFGIFAWMVRPAVWVLLHTTESSLYHWITFSIHWPLWLTIFVSSGAATYWVSSLHKRYSRVADPNDLWDNHHMHRSTRSGRFDNGTSTSRAR